MGKSKKEHKKNQTPRKAPHGNLVPAYPMATPLLQPPAVSPIVPLARQSYTNNIHLASQGKFIGKVTPDTVGKFGDVRDKLLTPYERQLFVQNFQIEKKIHVECDSGFWKAFLDPRMPVLSGETGGVMWSKISQYINKPSDSIILNDPDAGYLESFWRPKENPYENGVPADIVFAKTLPMTNFEIQIMGSSYSQDKGEPVRFRFMIFDGWEETVDHILSNDNDDESGIIGAFGHYAANVNDMFAYLPVVVKKGEDELQFLGAGWKFGKVAKAEYKDAEAAFVSYGLAALEFIAPTMIGIWYGAELSMLNPLTKVIFTKPKTETYEPSIAPYQHIPMSTRLNKTKKRKLNYVRKHVIPIDSFKNAMTTSVEVVGKGGHRSFTRKTLSWYVIGHWRKLHSGESVFVKGHWRGPLRKVKQNLDLGRDRTIELPNQQKT